MRESAISRIALGHASAWNARYPRWKHVVPLPPESLMRSVGGNDVENFLVVADAWAQVVSRFTTPGCSVLDMGSGCGRTARVLRNNRWISVYIGFDVVAESVAWCNNFIKPAWLGVRCEFHHADIYSGEYNPNGALKGVEFAFPCANASMDVVFAASLFTHLLEQDARHYLCEVRRVLKPCGRAILSIHNQVPPGVDYFGTEARIDVSTEYFEEIATDAGLRVVDRVPDLAGQVALIFAPAEPSRGRLERIWQKWLSLLRPAHTPEKRRY
jgi:SAM-dependent methyltransferase